jgi:hypothetical protein
VRRCISPEWNAGRCCGPTSSARVAGFSVDDEGHAVGLRCSSAPIVDETGDVVAAVSAAGPLARIVGSFRRCGRAVRIWPNYLCAVIRWAPMWNVMGDFIGVPKADRDRRTLQVDEVEESGRVSVITRYGGRHAGNQAPRRQRGSWRPPGRESPEGRGMDTIFPFAAAK